MAGLRDIGRHMTSKDWVAVGVWIYGAVQFSILLRLVSCVSFIASDSEQCLSTFSLALKVNVPIILVLLGVILGLLIYGLTSKNIGVGEK